MVNEVLSKHQTKWKESLKDDLNDMACDISSIVVAQLRQMGALGHVVDKLVNPVNASGQNAVVHLNEGPSGCASPSLCYNLDEPYQPTTDVSQGT